MLVSIIVPIYNVEPYLRRCLDSLINQTLKDIEIICINDCSPDNSLAILKECAEKDDRIKIINFEKNQGVSIARNAGIDAAKGEYIGTVYPDDYVDLDYYEKLYYKAKETGANMVQAGYKIKKIGMKQEYSICINGKKNKYDKLFSHCCLIFRTEFLHKNLLYYPNGIRLSEDVFFLVKTAYFANKIETVSDVYYHYINRENSASVYIGGDVHDSYGMPLVFDFINEQITDKIEYGHFFGHFFGHLIFLFARVAPEWKQVFVSDMIDIYKKRKYPVFLPSVTKQFEDCLENAEELYKRLEKNSLTNPYPKIEITIPSTKKIYIWGAGGDGIEALSQCESIGLKVEAFLDSNAETIKEFNGYKVFLPNTKFRLPIFAVLQ